MESSSESSYSSSITRIAVAQICQSAGYTAAQKPALNTLTDVATLYLQALAKSAASSAASFRRTQSNAFDVVLALEHLRATQGFPGASHTNAQCVLASSLLPELHRFVVYNDEIPFAKPLEKRKCDDHVDVDVGGGVKANHVPRWLPVMPVINDEAEEEGWKGERRVELRGEGKERVRNGMGSRSGGFGKRVLCQSSWKSGGEGVEKKKKVMVSFKKRLK